MIDRAAVAVGTTLGSGFFPIAPGTVGSAIAIVVLWLLPPLAPLFFFSLIVLFYLIGIWASARCEKLWGKDPGRVNWDEVVGQMIAVFWLPQYLSYYIAAFFLFRLFDIWKPSPVRNAEDLPSGLGIMTDDVAAGFYSLLVLQIVHYVSTHYF
jgi:phosphatidylglycerophosphatase A